MAPPILEIENLRKSYGSLTALDGVSLDVEPGEILGLLGPNGAGKTTLLSILTGLLSADSGSVRLLGRPFQPTDRWMRRLMGLAPQDLAIYPGLTAWENLIFFGRLYGLDKAEVYKRADQLLSAVGLTDRATSRTGTFSGGMKRRLNLAIAVIHQPKILFLDEPTTGVDPQSRHHIFEQVRRLNSEGMTVIYTSHYLEEVQTLCQRIAILDGGRILACDTLPRLLGTLDTIVSLEVDSPHDGLRETLSRLPGVRSLTEVSSTRWQLAVHNPASLLAAFARECAHRNVEPTAIHVNEPTLERVFLHLTGHELRD